MSEIGLERRRVRPYLRIDVIGGALVCILAAVIWLESVNLPVGELRYFGPGFLPRILVLFLFGGGLVLFIMGLVQPPGAAERLVLSVRGPALVGLAIVVFATTIRGLPLGPFAIPQLGLLVAGPLTVLIAGLGSVEARWRELVVLGIGLTAASVLVFTDLLGMQVPVFPRFLAGMLPVAWGPDWPRRGAVLAYAILGYGLWRLFGLTWAAIADKPIPEEPTP
jgi:hypothetical protein